MVPSVTIFDRPTAKNGFALVELLIVMAIVTVLVAVAVPVTIQARSRARMAACLSNLRQLGDALSAYSQDWEDKLPRLAGRPFAGSWPSAEWPEGSSATHMRRVLMRYARNAEVFRCGDDVGSPEYGYDGRSGPVYSRAGTSYLPWSTVRAGRYGVAINGVQTSQITRLSSIVLLRDYGSDWHGYLTRNGLSTEAVTVANAAYADGHSASVRIYSAGISGRTYVCWATGSLKSAPAVFVAGGSGGVEAELSGRCSRAHTSAQSTQLELRLSGMISTSGMFYSLDRVFVLGPDTHLESAFRQVVNWIESLAAE